MVIEASAWNWKNKSAQRFSRIHQTSEICRPPPKNYSASFSLFDNVIRFRAFSCTSFKDSIKTHGGKCEAIFSLSTHRPKMRKILNKLDTIFKTLKQTLSCKYKYTICAGIFFFANFTKFFLHPYWWHLSLGYPLSVHILWVLFALLWNFSLIFLFLACLCNLLLNITDIQQKMITTKEIPIWTFRSFLISCFSSHLMFLVVLYAYSNYTFSSLHALFLGR